MIVHQEKQFFIFGKSLFEAGLGLAPTGSDVVRWNSYWVG